MTRITTITIAAVCLLGFGPLNSIAIAACSSGPDFCQDDPRIPTVLAAKKKSIVKNGFPKKYADLLDKGSKCVAKIERAPDIISHLIVEADGSKQTMAWEEVNHKNLLKGLENGSIARFWIMNARKALSCDGEPNYDQMPDYDAEDEINTTQAIKCTKSSGC
jgi:hypothetical protein